MVKPNFITTQNKLGKNKAQFIIKPLPPSFGHSLGNSLRRTLLSSLEGAVITQVKIDNVPHLFSTLEGVKESVLEIVLAVKQLRFKTTGRGRFKVYLEANSPGKLYGKNIEGEAEVVNGDIYLAEITGKNIKFKLEAIVETGIGYIKSEDQKDVEYGFIPVDAFFSPVEKVNYRIESTRVGRRSDYDSLIMEIETDGSLSPQKALKQATGILSDFFSFLLSGNDEVKEEEALEEAQEIERKEKDKRLEEIIIDELNLPSRVINALLKEKVETVADLVNVGLDKVIDFKGVGKKSINLIEAELAKMDIKLD